jgi:hypothetical protein
LSNLPHLPGLRIVLEPEDVEDRLGQKVKHDLVPPKVRVIHKSPCFFYRFMPFYGIV